MTSDLQAIKHWKTYASEFTSDGSLRDILILGTSLGEWREAMKFVAAQDYEIRFRQKCVGNSFPDSIEILFPSVPGEELALLSIDVSNVVVNCHFFTQDQIEFDLVPNEVRNALQLAGLFAFMHGLASATGKDVLMTPENMPESPIFRCRPKDDWIHYEPFFNGRDFYPAV